MSMVKYDNTNGNPFADKASAPGLSTKYTARAMKKGLSTDSS